MSNPFLLENIEQPEQAANENPFSMQAIEADQRQDLRINIRRAVETNPDDASEAARLAKRYPAPNDVLLRNLRDVKLQEAVDKADERLKTSPKLADYMRTGGDFAKQAHDDVEPLAQIEQFFRDTGGSVKAGLFNSSKGAAGMFRGGAELLAPTLDVLEPITAIGGNPLRRIAEGFSMLGNQAGATADAAAPKTDGILDSGFQSGVQSFTQNALMLPLAFAPGGQGAALGGMVGFTGGQSYQDAREKGLSMSQALPYAVSQAAIEYATEKLPLAQLIGDVKVGAPIYEMIAKQMALEIPGEQIATILQDLNDWAVLNPEKPFSNYLEARPSAAAQTLVATIVGTGGNIAVVKGMEKSMQLASDGLAKIQQSEKSADALKGVLQTALQSKLRQRNPDAFREAVQNMADTTEGAPSSIYIDAEVLNQSIQSMDPAEVAKAFPTLAAQMGPALASGGVIELPIGDVLAAAPGSALEEMLLQNSRSTPDGLSLVEATQASEKAGEFLKTEADRVLSEAQDQAVWQSSAETVKTTILDQLNTAGRFKSDVNEAYATLVRDFYSATAGRLGMTPEQLYAKYPLRVAADIAGGDVLEQSPTGQQSFETTHADKGGEQYKIALRQEMLGQGADRQLSVIVDATSPDGSRRATVNFAVDGNTLSAENTITATAYQRKGLAEAMYRAAREAGYDIAPGRKQTADGDKMVARLREKGVINADRGVLNQSSIDQTETEAFKKWFGDSKVVDANGQPLVVYHGTNVDVTEFKNSKKGARDPGFFGRGFYFTPSEDVALNYADSAADADGAGDAKAIPVYLSLQNPFVWDMEAGDGAKATLHALRAMGIARTFVRGDAAALGNPEERKKFNNAMVAGGHDGVIIRDEDGFREIVAFDPAQIKSATGNRGTFDPNDPNILRQSGDGFARFIGDAARVDIGDTHEFKAGEPVVVAALHGTTGDFTSFDRSMANIESDLGGGFYFTNNPADVGENYAGMGPDLTNKIQGEAERLESNDELDPDEAMKIARDKWMANDGLTMPVWVKMTNPVVLGGSRETFLSYEESYDEDTEEYGEPTGDLVKVIDALREVASDERYGDADIEQTIGELMEKALDNAGLSARELIATAKLSEGLVYATDYEADGKLAPQEILRLAFESAGFDGFIDQTVDEKFGSSSEGQRKYGKGMKGMDADTVHFIAFKPNQIKSRLGNRGTFDPNDPNILRQADDGVRATFSPSQLAITLGEKADLSSFLHESGHFFLEVMADLSTQPDAPAQVVQDMAEAMKWFGVADVATWQGMTLEEQRPYHEKWAESFEQYLLEGKSPSTELQPLFRRFRAWMVNVYKSLAQFMRSRNLALSPEIRQVFDRMLATDEQIRQAEESAGMLPDFDATNEAIEKLQSRSLQDLKWTVNAKSKAIKVLQRQAKDLRKAVESEVRAEVEDRPVYAARKAFKEIQKLDVEGLTDMYEGDGNKYALLDWKPLQNQKLVGKDGAHPDSAADAFGFDSGDALVKALLEAPPMAEVIQQETDQRMLEEYGDLTDPQAIEEAANEAVHNEARARSLATEFKAQSDAMNPREEVGTARNGRKITVNAITEAAKQFAQDLTARRKIRELKNAAAQHRASELRASKKWAEATAKGDTAEAVKAKRDQLLNNYTAKALQEADVQTRKQLDYLKKFDRESTRKKLPTEYLDQIDKLLEGVDLRVSTSGRDIDRRASLRAWVDSQEEKGLPTAIPDYLLDESGLVSYKEMTVEEFGGLIDSIKNIEHLGRLKNKLLTLKDKREFAEMEAQIVDTIVENGGKTIPVELEGRKPIKRWLQGMAAGHRKISSLVRQMTGLKDGGPLWDALVRPMNDAGNTESVMIEQATEKLSEIYKPLLKLKGGLGGNKIFIPEINASLSRGGRLAVLLNWGNTQNRQRIMGGDQWTDGQVRAILSHITPVEAQFANDVWDYIDTFWPLVKAKQERVSGVVEKKVEAEPFTLLMKDGTTFDMRGGYYPIKYDSERSSRAEAQEAAEVAKDMMRGAFTRATTRRGHTKARTDEVNRPVRKNLDVITQHVTQVVHDLAWHEWIIDANRIMSSSKIDEAMRTHYGPDVIATMKDGIVGIATSDVVPQTRIDDALRLLRSNVSRSTMGLSLTTALLQPFGLTQSMVRIGPKHVMRGVARFGGDAVRFENSMKWISEKSDFMRLRSKSFNREIREISGRVAGKSATMQAIDGGLFWLMQKMQLVADVPTWIGAYEKALSEGVDDSTAVARADQSVLDSQGGGQTKDMSEIQRKHPMLTQFYSYFSVTLNLAAESTATTNFKNPKAVAGWLGDMALLAVIPAIAPAIVLHMLKGGGDDDPEAWAKRILEWQAGYLLGMVVGLRELSGAVSGFDYGGPPSGRIIADISKAGQQTAQGEIDEPAVMAFIRLLGSAFGIPTVQATRSYRGWVAWSEGDAPASSILFGPPPRE